MSSQDASRVTSWARLNGDGVLLGGVARRCTQDWADWRREAGRVSEVVMCLTFAITRPQSQGETIHPGHEG